MGNSGRKLTRARRAGVGCAVVAAVAALAVAAPASADDVVYGRLSLEGGVVVYRATPGLVNDQWVNWGNWSADEDFAPTFMGDDFWAHEIEIDDSCGDSLNQYASCTNGGGAPRVEVWLGDGDDVGDAGNDRGLGNTVVQHGETGNDTLSGDISTDVLDGGPGDDDLTPDGMGIFGSTHTSNGDEVIGGAGTDKVHLHTYASPLMRVTLDDVANDGETADDGITSIENDNIHSDVENVVGAEQAPNHIVGSAAANVITIDNSYGDTVDGGAGVDTISTGGGDDTVLARDGERDVIDCGAGFDRVAADQLDEVTHCEQVDRGAAAPGAGVGAAKVVKSKKPVKVGK